MFVCGAVGEFDFCRRHQHIYHASSGCEFCHRDRCPECRRLRNARDAAVRELEQLKKAKP